MTPADGVASHIAAWRPSSVSPQAAGFARAVVARAVPGSRERAKSLLWAAARHAEFGISLGLAPVPEVLLHPSVIERFAAAADGLSGPARRTLRTNLRFLARRVVPELGPAPAPLPRERCKAPYSHAEIAGYLALAGAQPTRARRMRAAGLVALGAGAGLTGADLRQVHGADIVCRCGGVVVLVRGRRPRVVPVLSRYHDPLLGAAAFAGAGLVTGGRDPARQNVTTPLISALSGGTDLPRLDTGRLRASWLRDCAQRLGLATFMAAAGITCSQRLGDLVATLPVGDEAQGRGAAGRNPVSQVPLADLEQIIDRSPVAARVEALLPVGVRSRQLRVRTLLLGMLLTMADHRPAHLTRVHQALTGLAEADRIRLGVLADWKHGPHLLTYRQTERTLGLVVAALGKDEPDGAPTAGLTDVVDTLLEASVPAGHKNTTTALAVDWTDLETFSRPPPRGSRDCADPEASWGHRRGGGPGQDSELFYGYYLQAATMVAEEHGPPVPELARRITLTSCHHDPARALVPVLRHLPDTGVPLGDVLADSGYAHRAASGWAVPLRAAGASLVQDLHPADRGPKGTHAGAVIANGNLYCPVTPRPLLELGPLSRDATPEQIAAHDRQTAEAARYKLGRITADDADGYHRVMCPAVMGKLRCPLRPESMALDRQRPEILTPPQHPRACCAQQTVTVGPEACAKTAQKHDYPSAAHRRSYARRTAAERTFSTAKDPASNDIGRGWCRLMGLTALTLFTACLFIVRNQRILATHDARQALQAQREAAGRPPATRRRRRRRRTLADLAAPP